MKSCPQNPPPARAKKSGLDYSKNEVSFDPLWRHNAHQRADFAHQWGEMDAKNERGWNEYEALRGIKTGMIWNSVSAAREYRWNEYEALRGIKTIALITDR